MATLNMRTAARDPNGRLLTGQGGSFGPSRDGHHHVTFPREPSLDERIYTVVWRSGGAVSRADIAKGVGKTKASWLNAKIEGLVEAGKLVRRVGVHTNGYPKFFYEVAQ